METTWRPSLERSDQPLYLTIASAISSDIERGCLRSGTKLPTQRDLADQLGVALGTVTRAYTEAERRGLIRGEGRRGTFVGRSESSRSILSEMVKRAAHGIDLSKNHPLYQFDPDLSVTLHRIARGKNAQELLQYPPAAGFMRHREAGARWLTALGARTDPESVFVTYGAQHALSLIMAAEARHGDVIAAEKYTYPGVRAIAEQLGLQVVGVPTDAEGIIPEELDSLCRQKAVRLLYCNPSLQNPTNAISSRKRREDIAAVADQHGFMIIEDEIMRPLLTEHPGYIADMLPEQTFLTISISKSVAAGLRIGFIRAPARTHQGLVESLNASCLGTPPLTAEVFTHWLEDGTLDQTIARRRQDMAARQQLAAGLLAGLKFRNHPVSYHVWLELPHGWTGLKLAMDAQLRGVMVTPAEVFAVDPRLPASAIRLSVSGPPTQDLLASGIQTVVGLLRGTASHNQATV